MQQICQRIRFLNFVKGRGCGIDDGEVGNVAGDGRLLIGAGWWNFLVGDGLRAVPCTLLFIDLLCTVSFFICSSLNAGDPSVSLTADCSPRRGSAPRRRFGTGETGRRFAAKISHSRNNVTLSLPYHNAKTAPMFEYMGAALPGSYGAFFLGAEVCVLR